jgi:hypothetical protein
MFATVMPWPMTLALTNEAIRRENQTIYRYDLGGHARCKDSVTIKKGQDFVRVGERRIEFTILICMFLIYRTSLSVNGITRQILSLSVLIPHGIMIVPLV